MARAWWGAAWVACALGWACSGDPSGKADGADGGDGASDGGDALGDGSDGTDATDGDEVAAEPNAWIEGRVRVQLYTLDEAGDIEFVAWPDDYAGTFPFGSIFLAGVDRTKIGDSGAVGLWLGHGVVRSPSPDGDSFTLPLTLDSQKEAILFGALDYWGNDIIHSTDPVGTYAQEILVRPGDTLTGFEFTILARYEDFGGRTAAQAAAEDGSDERSGCDDVTLSGVIDVTVTDYVEGEAVAYLIDQDNAGPYDWTWVDLVPTAEGGARGEYSFQSCSDQGYVRLQGAWDNNRNQLIDPMDVRGNFATAPGTSGNPVTVASTDLEDHAIEIPLSDGEDGLNLVPFIQLSGTVGMLEGFDSLPSGASVVVAATKYRRNGSLDLDSFVDDSYGYQVFEWPDLTGRSTVNWSFVVPADTLIYLWAYADHDGNGVVNEVGEAVAAGGGDPNGRLQTGETNSSHNLTLAAFSDPPGPPAPTGSPVATGRGH